MSEALARGGRAGVSRSPRGRNARRMTEMPLSLGVSRVSGETALNPGVSDAGGPKTQPVELPGCQAGSERSGRPSGGMGWEESSG